jgi:hypothetical protein
MEQTLHSGGTSLKTIKVVARIETVFDIVAPFKGELLHWLEFLQSKMD